VLCFFPHTADSLAVTLRRRELMAMIAAAATAPAGLSLGQPAGSLRKIGALFSQAEGDTEGMARASAFQKGLKDLGWNVGGNIEIDYRWSGGHPDRMRQFAEALVRQQPAAILAAATTALVALQRATRTVPIVFAQVTDPVGSGFVASLARPGGNITGLTQHEFVVGEKWVEMLKQVAPMLTRVAVLYDPSNPATGGYLQVLRTAAASASLQVRPYPIRDRAEIERAMNDFAGEPDGGTILLPGPAGSVHRDLVIALAARHRLPSIFAFRYHVVSGGLISYGVDNVDLFNRAAWYVDRILRGAAPGELPVQHASKFQLVINLKTAKSLGLTVPLSLLTSADEVIE
jgi:putative tryptophan/tyrosine transport system substrate-binding protein